MRNIVRIAVSCLFALALAFTYGCKKADTPQKVSQTEEERKFNPDEPAPVPKGTPPY